MTPESATISAQTEPRASPNGAPAEIDRCLEELTQLAQSELLAAEFYAALLDRALRVLPAVGCAAWRVTPGRLEMLSQLHFPRPLESRQRPALSDNGQPGGTQPFVVPPYARASAAYPCDNPHPWPLVVCPLASADLGSVVIEIALEPDVGTDVQAGAVQLVGVLAEIAADFHRRRELARLRQRESQLAGFADLVLQFHARLDPVAAAYAIANDGRKWIDCDRVSVLRLKHGRAITLAVSAVDRVDRQSGQVAALERLAAAVAASGEPLAWREGDTEELPPQLAGVLQAYLDLGHARQLSATLLQRDQSPPLGVLVAESFVAAQPLETVAERAGEVARVGGPALGNALAHHALPLLSLQERLAQAGLALARRPVAATLAVVGLAVAIALLAVVPADFSVPAEGALQPQARRNLFAPCDGVVAEVLVEHGQRVAAGEVLLRIRNPSLDLEQSRLSGELQTAQAKLDAVRSTRSRPDSSNPASDRDRLASEEEQLKEQVQSLENQLVVLQQLRGELNVTSPLSGVVLTWNTRQLLADRPVKQGHSLLAVADPKGPWVLELRVKDAEVGHVLTGQRGNSELPVTFLLASDPALTHRGHLQQLALATDAADGPAAAEAVVALDGSLPEGVRAGSGVTARIHCGHRSVGYVWLHDLIDFVRTSLLF